ncbi:MAG: ferrochelatase [Gammaproteobacteria bacterium]|nr:MAG: ferrochelatase [Gammaproteobacteria bacterium]
MYFVRLVLPFFSHPQKNRSMSKTHVLIVNLGSPDDTSVPAVRRYLAEFLSDKRVVDLPRWQWWPILHGIILRTRPAKTAASYQQIWTATGSPLVVTTRKQAQLLGQRFVNDGVSVHYAMRYGNPSIGSVLNDIITDDCDHLLVFPLYPQYSRTTVETVRDKVTLELAKRSFHFSVDHIDSYYNNEGYIQAMADHIRNFQAQYEQPDKLIFSYHGIPKRYAENGDVYPQHCHETTRLLVEKLGLSPSQYLTTFQSRFGREEWLQPYTDETLKALAQKGDKIVHVLSPAFSADCLETLEELEVENRGYFEKNGGKIYRYIPALNDDERHIDVLESIIRQRLSTRNGNA